MHSKIPIEEDPDLSVIYLIFGRRDEVKNELEFNLGYKVEVSACDHFDDIMDSDEKQLHVVIESDDEQLIEAAKGTIPHLIVAVENGTNIHDELGAFDSNEIDSNKILSFHQRSYDTLFVSREKTLEDSSKAKERVDEWVVLETRVHVDHETTDDFETNYSDHSFRSSSESLQSEILFVPPQSEYDRLANELSISKEQVRSLQLENEALRREIDSLRVYEDSTSERSKGQNKQKHPTEKRKQHLQPFRLVKGNNHSLLRESEPAAKQNQMLGELNPLYSQKLFEEPHSDSLEDRVFLKSSGSFRGDQIQDLPTDQIESLSLD